MQYTALHDEHLKLKAKMVDFGGWHMPVSYSTVLTEHKIVRESCGIFDVSHMGEIFVTGKDATAYLRHVAMNDVAKLRIGMGQYTAILNDNGGFVDDLIIYQIESDGYLICANASNVDKDYAWLNSQIKNFDVKVSNRSQDYSQIAIQGPTCLNIAGQLFDAAGKAQLAALPYTGIATMRIDGCDIFVARTGYTGEKGFELYLPNKIAATVWNQCLSHHQSSAPIGLGARDTLRLEACYLLYGNDMNDAVSPLEAGVAWAVAIDRGDFIGRDALLRQREQGVPRSLRAFKMADEGIARQGMSVWDRRGNNIGVVTSGSVLPTVGGAGGMCLIDSKCKDSEVEIDLRGKRKLANLVKRPLYQARTK